MISTIVVPGTKLDMIRLRKSLGEEVEGKQYNSKVLDFMDDESMKIATPFEHGLIVPLEIGEIYQFIFYTERGLYHCKGEIVDRYKEGRLSVLVVCLLNDLEKFQRRQFYRLEYTKEISYRVISPEEVSYKKRIEERRYNSDEERRSLEQLIQKAQAQWNTATIIDISGGGCRFYSKFLHEVGQISVVVLRYSYQGKSITGQYNARLISSSTMEKRKGYFEYRVEFKDISVVEREKLIKFIFEEERKMRQRERGLS